VHLAYPAFMPQHLRYRYCPMCTGQLTNLWDADGLFRAQCAACGWTYYPPNVNGVVVVVTTPDGVVFLFPPDEPAESPAALPAGSAEFGETPEEAAVREVREETGLEVEIVNELGRMFTRDSPVGPMLGFLFEARMVGGTLRDGLEGRVAVYREGEFPVISPNRGGSQQALAAYLESRR
jgi:8-oxo-dGTP diphosphatase